MNKLNGNIIENKIKMNIIDKRRELKIYDFLKDYNSGHMILFYVSERSVAKTTSFKRILLADYVVNDNMFIGLSRSQEEVKISFKSGASKFPQFTANSKTIETKRGGNIAGFFASLSGANKVKLGDYPKVKTIVFDEFLPENGIYGENEIQPLLSIFSTAGRLRDDIRIIFLSNRVSKDNQYTRAFGFEFPAKGCSVVKNIPPNETMKIVHLAPSVELEQAILQSRSYKLSNFLKLEDYMYGDGFLHNEGNFIMQKCVGFDKKFKHKLVINNKTYGVGVNQNDDWGISEDYNDNGKTIYLDEMSAMENGVRFQTNQEWYAKIFRSRLLSKSIGFQTEIIKDKIKFLTRDVYD